MDYIFVGQNILGGMTLRGLLLNGLEPLLVITREANDYPNLVYEVATEYGVAVETTSDINKDTRLVNAMMACRPDVVFCCSWGNRIKKPLLGLPNIGWVNFHPSYLPEYRGPRPIEWQLITGEEWGGCTAHFMTQRFDDGPIIIQRRIRISISDNGETMRFKCGRVMAELAYECYRMLARNPGMKGTPQDETKASYAPPREHVRLINWELPAVSVYNLVRGLSPYPCAVFYYQGHELNIAEVTITNIKSGRTEIGQIRESDDGKLLIGAQDYFIKVTKLRLENDIVDANVAEIGKWLQCR